MITDLIKLKAQDINDVAVMDCAKGSELLTFAEYKEAKVGSGLAFAYNVITELPKASTRAVGGKPVPQAPTIRQESGIMKIITSAIPVDSVFNATGGDGKELHTLARTSTQAVANELVALTVDGDTAKDAQAFNGFAKLVKGTSTDLAEVIDKVDISLGCTDIEQAGRKLMQVIANARGKMGSFKPNMILCGAETKELIGTALKNTGLITSQTVETLGMTVEKYGNMTLVGTDLAQSLEADADGYADVYLIHWNKDEGCRYQVPQGAFISQSMPNIGNNGSAVAEGYTQAIAHLVVPSSKCVARFKVRILPATV